MYPALTAMSTPRSRSASRTAPSQLGSVAGRLDDQRLDAGVRRPLEGAHARPVGQDERRLRADRRVVEQGLQVRAPARDEHRDPPTHGGGHAIRAWSRAGQGR